LFGAGHQRSQPRQPRKARAIQLSYTSWLTSGRPGPLIALTELSLLSPTISFDPRL
jgi:hypothetical protein